MKRMSKQGGAVLSSVLELVVPGGQNLAESGFVGTWRVQDTAGTPFEIILSAMGTAEATRAGEGMSGTWIEEGLSAIITWDTGWTTKITRTGAEFVKTAYDPAAAAPTNTSLAEKVV